MIIVMQQGAPRPEIDAVEEEIRRMGYTPHPIYGVERTVIGAIGDERDKARLQVLETSPGVENVIPILKPYKLAGRELRQEKSRVSVGPTVVFGGPAIPVIAGPCSVESRDQICRTAEAVKKAGAAVLRGGAYKPRTSPYSFQGLGREGLRILAAAKRETGLPVVTEVLDPRDLDAVAEVADVLQVGARSMQNFPLLKELGRARKPVLLKRGLSATIEEWLLAAEYVLYAGNPVQSRAAASILSPSSSRP